MELDQRERQQVKGYFQHWCKTVCPTLAVPHCQVLASSSLLCWYYFVRCSYELSELVQFLILVFATIPKWYKDVYVNSFFPLSARLWNFFACRMLFFDLWYKCLCFFITSEKLVLEMPLTDKKKNLAWPWDMNFFKLTFYRTEYVLLYICYVLLVLEILGLSEIMEHTTRNLKVIMQAV